MRRRRRGPIIPAPEPERGAIRIRTHPPDPARPGAAGAMLPVYAALLFVQLFFGTLPIAVKFALRELTSPALAP